MPEKLTKSERRLVARGRGEGRRNEAERNRMNSGIEGIASLVSAFGSQKWLADVGTPLLPMLPLHYTLGAGLVLAGMSGRQTRTKAALSGLGTGLIVSQLGVSAYKQKQPLFGP
jgi:hypothetical protein